MKNRKFIVIILCMVMILAFAVSGCAKKTSIDLIKEKGQIVWGTNAAFMPFEGKEGTKVIGADAEFAQKLADKLGVKLVVEDIDFDALIPSLQSGKIDFIGAGMTAKPERAEKVDFSKSYWTAVQTVIVKTDNNAITTVDDLKGKHIGVQLDTIGDFVATDDIENTTVERYNNIMLAAEDLKNGKIEVLITDDMPAKMIAQKVEGLKILDIRPSGDEQYGYAVRKGDAELLKVINDILDEMAKTQEMDKLVQKYSLGE